VLQKSFGFSLVVLEVIPLGQQIRVILMLHGLLVQVKQMLLRKAEVLQLSN
jgi:hypothetical protein